MRVQSKKQKRQDAEPDAVRALFVAAFVLFADVNFENLDFMQSAFLHTGHSAS